MLVRLCVVLLDIFVDGTLDDVDGFLRQIGEDGLRRLAKCPFRDQLTSRFD